jgi:peptidoglycan/xylan/chitin deacetylase (PgdA/CDA1 family)
MIPHHDRYDYVPIIERPDYSWPDGKRLAVHIALNIEHFAWGGLGHFPTSVGHPPDHRNYAWREYGVRVGVWSLFDLLDDLELPASHLVNSLCYEHYPQIFERIHKRGDEIVGHGRTNSELQGERREADEMALIQEATDVITKYEGAPPKGWMGPWISESQVTPDLLKEAGYLYSMDWPCDDQAVWMRTRAGPLLSVPYPIEINDAPSQLNRFDQPVDFRNMVIDQFEMMLELSHKAPLIMGVSLHTFIFGQPFRLRHLRQALRHLVEHPQADKVWFTRPGEITDHVIALPSGTLAGSP